MRISFIILVSVLVSFNAAQAQTCAGSVNKIEDVARSYMREKKLIHEGDEQTFPELGIKIRWELIKVVPVKNGCAVVMAVCNSANEEKSCEEGPVEVLGLSKSKNVYSMIPFESLYPVAKKVIAKIGSKDSNDLSYYYVELSGNSALAATKSIVGKVPYSGFSGVAVLGKKASFDPNTNRNWRIIRASFDLRRGSTAEVLDVQAYQFDGLDSGGAEGYWTGCEKVQNKQGTCSVAPWAQAFIRELTPIK